MFKTFGACEAARRLPAALGQPLAGVLTEEGLNVLGHAQRVSNWDDVEWGRGSKGLLRITRFAAMTIVAIPCPGRRRP